MARCSVKEKHTENFRFTYYSLKYFTCFCDYITDKPLKTNKCSTNEGMQEEEEEEI
jgi:hypothetical protein